MPGCITGIILTCTRLYQILLLIGCVYPQLYLLHAFLVNLNAVYIIIRISSILY